MRVRSPTRVTQRVMLTTLIATLLGLLAPDVTDAEADALRSTAPAMLTRELARDHLAAARVVAASSGLDPAMLLAIAAHESNYEPFPKNITPEPPARDGAPRWSCGAMTPTPITDYAECTRIAKSTLAGYLAGADHLITDWFRPCRGNLRCMLRGYAGAWTVRDQCAGADQPRSCRAAWWFEARAHQIRQALTRARATPRPAS